MKLLIDIPEEYYKALQKVNEMCAGIRGKDRPFDSQIFEAVGNGTKVQGRLIDANRLKAEVFRACMDEHFMPMKSLDCDTITEIIDKAQTIIEAETEE